MRVEAAGGTACMSRPMGATPKIENATVKTRARERSPGEQLAKSAAWLFLGAGNMADPAVAA